MSVGLVTAVFAAFSSSTSYQLNSYGIGPGGTNSSTSTSYSLQGSAGEQANGTSSGTTDIAHTGSVQTEQIAVPPAPTLSNGSGIDYNELNFIVNTGQDPSDATYAVAVSTGSCNNSPLYVQASGALGASQVYQSYSPGWGGGTGSFVTGLSSNTTYYVNVAAKQGQFTNTEFGACASLATASVSTTFSIAPSTITLSNLLPATVITSSNMTANFATNASYGGAVYVSGANSGLYSTSQNSTIAAITGNLGALSQGSGLQATGPTESSGGPLLTVSPFNGTGNSVGAESVIPAQILSSTTPIVGGLAYVNFQAEASKTTPAGTDYQEVLTFIGAGSFYAVDNCEIRFDKLVAFILRSC